eukprot:TRINITY_DN9473_c0_g4_i1.p1 TRINITY_DN9473_c0_g4~~TRINITY_DN9473_c0_g4_i1.p1  ORF type:complete len:660 (-),score=110.90 TRINITY_DN9473_c0_g4_i1:34-2013(-)
MDGQSRSRLGMDVYSHSSTHGVAAFAAMAAVATDSRTSSPTGLQEKLRRHRQLALERYRANCLGGSGIGAVSSGAATVLQVDNVPSTWEPQALSLGRKQDGWSLVSGGLRGPPSPTASTNAESNAAPLLPMLTATPSSNDVEAAPKQAPALVDVAFGGSVVVPSVSGTNVVASVGEGFPKRTSPPSPCSTAAPSSTSSSAAASPASSSTSVPASDFCVTGPCSLSDFRNSSISLASSAASAVPAPSLLQSTPAVAVDGSGAAALVAAVANQGDTDLVHVLGSSASSGALPPPTSRSGAVASAAPTGSSASVAGEPRITGVKGGLSGAVHQTVGKPSPFAAAGAPNGVPTPVPERRSPPLPSGVTVVGGSLPSRDLFLSGTGFAAGHLMSSQTSLPNTQRSKAQVLGWNLDTQDEEVGDSLGVDGSRPSTNVIRDAVMPLLKFEEPADKDESCFGDMLEGVETVVERRGPTSWSEELNMSLRSVCSMNMSGTLPALPPGVLLEDAAEDEKSAQALPWPCSTGQKNKATHSDLFLSTLTGTAAWAPLPGEDGTRDDVSSMSGTTDGTRQRRLELAEVGRGFRERIEPVHHEDSPLQRRPHRRGGRFGGLVKYLRDSRRHPPTSTMVRPIEPNTCVDLSTVTRTEVYPVDTASYGDETVSVD